MIGVSFHILVRTERPRGLAGFLVSYDARSFFALLTTIGTSKNMIPFKKFLPLDCLFALILFSANPATYNRS